MKRLSKLTVSFLLFLVTIILSGCASFAGLRTPLYDGEPIVEHEEATALYKESKVIHDDFQEDYYRYPLSDSLFEESLDFTGKESIVLEGGNYVVGEEVEPGRVYLQGAESDFSPDMWIIHTAKMTVRDEEGVVTFENHFQDGNGVMTAVVDLREGDTIELSGNDPLVTVYYEDLTQMGEFIEEGQTALIAGHFEVGKHIEAGTYEWQNGSAPRTSELYHFKSDGETDVIELTTTNWSFMMTHEENDELYQLGYIGSEEHELNRRMIDAQSGASTIELANGDKLYIPMIYQIVFEKVD